MSEIDIEFNDEELLEEALERFKVCEDAWEPIYKSSNEDHIFANGKQWDDSTISARSSNGRSSLTYNKISSNIRYIVNNAIANTPNIKVHPISNGATKNTAKVLDGLIKAIQNKSNANGIYVHGLKNAVTGGIGYFRITPKQNIINGELKNSIELEKIKDPTTVYFDPDAEADDMSDAEYVFIVRQLPIKRFEKLYPNAHKCSLTKATKSWYSKEQVRVAEYWVKENGKVSQYIISGEDVLENNSDYPGTILPVVMIIGEENYVDSKRDFKGIVRDVKDVQKLLNYQKSEAADYLSKAAKTQFLVEASMIPEEYQRIWNSANVANLPYLPYVSKDGSRPTPNQPLPPPSGLIEGASEADVDLRAIIGIKDPLADIPQTQSGKAISLQIQQGNIGILSYLNNLKVAIKRAGEILLDLIPHYYSRADVVEILGIDDQVTTVKINEPYVDNGEVVNHDLTIGQYGIIITTGPSYESQRSEASDKLMELVGRYPQMAQFAGDLIVKTIDFDGADELADRLKATIPPEILAASSPSNSNDGQMQMIMNQANQMSQALQQANVQIQQMQEALNKYQEVNTDLSLQLKNRDAELQLRQYQVNLEAQLKRDELDLKYRINSENNSSDLTKVTLNNEAKESLEITKSELKQDEEFAKAPVNVQLGML